VARTYFCPRCLRNIRTEEVLYRTRTGQPAEKPQDEYDRGFREWAQALWRGDPDPIQRIHPQQRAERDQHGIHAQCPEGHRIPSRAFDVPSMVVGLVGEPSSGKTVYLGTLLEQLDRGRLLPYLDFVLDERSQKLRTDVFQDFYTSGALPFPTSAYQGDAGREAITETAVTGDIERFYLSFFDASGEQNSVQDQGRTNRFLYVADTVMHFITPEALSLPRRFSGRRDDQRQAWFRTNEWVQTAIRAGDPRRAHAAVIITKSDDIAPEALDILVDAREDLAYSGELSLLRATQVIEEDSRYIRDFLRSLDGGLPLSIRCEEAYRSVSYHLVSATGEPADPVSRSFARRRPQRVLDPLLASLVHTGLLDAQQGLQVLR
jgi:hypothetical protein